MPIRKSGRKWTFGGGKFSSLAKAKRSYRAYRAKKHAQQGDVRISTIFVVLFVIVLLLWIF